MVVCNRDAWQFGTSYPGAQYFQPRLGNPILLNILLILRHLRRVDLTGSEDLIISQECCKGKTFPFRTVFNYLTVLLALKLV